MGVFDQPAAPIVCKNLIAGTWQESKSEQMEVLSPYTGRTIGRVPQSAPEELSAAVHAAHEAFPAWRATPIKERSQVLFRFRELLLGNLEKLGQTAAWESGKTVGEAKAGVMKGVEVVEYALSLQNIDVGGAMTVSRGVTCQYQRAPLGVVAGIAPFNFPAMVPLWMYPVAMALGNCFVLKPSEKVPLTSQVVGDLMQEAGCPAGVFSLVNGGRATVEGLIDHPLVKSVGFVGSTPVAKAVFQRASGLGKRCLALGGAKNHLIVAPDADPKLTVGGVVDSFTGCCGQRCMAASLMLAVGDVDALIEEIVSQAGRVTLGEQMGAIIDEASHRRIHDILSRVEAEGGRFLLDGRDVKPPKGGESGYWMGPTIVETTVDTECAREEIFGPVMTMVRVKNLAEAMEIEARSPYGNATSIFTTSGAAAKYVTEHATSGMIGINIGVPVPREPFSFGGTKDSKFGQGDITGEGALDFWSQRQKITTKWSSQQDHNWMS